MSEKIEPALTDEEWIDAREKIASFPTRLYWFEGLDDAQVIALANDLLPDTDDRKITRKKILAMRNCVWFAEGDLRGLTPGDEVAKWTGMLARFADALEALLPPPASP